MIDLRSDTVTIPSTQMRNAMATADVGDDVFCEDITIKCLEERVACMFNKDSALFFPSGTMSNLTAVLTWCHNRGAEFIVGDNSHMFLFEQSGPSQFGGVSPRTIHNLSDGTFYLNDVKMSIRDNDIHEPTTQLICIENTHNACGGKVLPICFMKNLKTIADTYNIPVHLDGARVWNAINALGVKPYEISNHVTSLSVCLSKGLGAPIGSLLVGPMDFIKRARRIRKALGGGMRQVGILGAAGLQALDDFESGMLLQDHIRTQKLAKAMTNLKSFTVRDFQNIQTNIIFADIVLYDKSWNTNLIACKVKTLLIEKGVKVSEWGECLIRFVVHRDINDNDIEQTIQALKDVDEYLSKF
jgi:threonine aldolase